MVAIMRIGAATPAPRRAPAAKRPPVRAPVSMSLSQQANRAVNQQLGPQIAAQNANNARQSQAIQGFAQALLGKLQPIAGQVGADYDRAIQQTGQLSGAAAQFLSNANPSGQVADLLRSTGAPEAQIGQVGDQLGQTFGGGAGVLSFLGGAVPGGELATDKAAMQGQARQLPGFAALRGQQDLASALSQQSIDRQKLEATRPGLYQTAYNDLASNQLRRQSIAASNTRSAASLAERKREFGISEQGKTADREAKQAAQDFLNWYRTEGIRQSDARINEKAAEFGVTAKQRDKQLSISAQNAATSATRAANAARHQAALERQADERIGVSRQSLALRKRAAAEKARTGGISATTYASLKKQAARAADLYYFGKVVKTSGQIDPDRSIAGLSYRDALAHLMTDFSLKAPDAKRILNEFYAAGERGRPRAHVGPTGHLGLQAVGP